MNPRERVLAATVGGVMVLGLVFVGYTTLSDMVATRKERVEALEKSIRDKEFEVTRGKLAMKQMSSYVLRSLSADSEQARSQYQAWLLDLVKQIGVRNSSVTAEQSRPHGNVYQEHGFALAGQVDLRQMTNLLFEFYSLDLLHRIKSINVSPVQDSNLLELTMRVEVLSLTDAPAKAEIPSEPANRLAHQRDEYLDAILNRNLFGPPNNPPRLASVSKKEVKMGDRLSLDVTAKDVDERQTLQYTLTGEPPAGMRIDAKTGRLEWSPRELGNYQVTVQVADDGLPAKRDEATFTVAVVEPPPPRAPEPAPTKPAFNLAEFSVLTAITEKSGRKQAWINVRPEGRMLKLHVGDDISVGAVTGIIREIANQQMIIETDEEMMIVALGKALTDAKLVP